MFQSSMQNDEEFDQEPGEDEIHEYAIIIGIDPVKEPELMWIARAGITAPLPPEWKPIQTNDNDLYFCNSKTGETSWEHPSDDKYRQMVLEERQSSSLKNQMGSTKNVKRDNNLVSTSNTLNKGPASLPSATMNLGKPGPRLAPVGLTPSNIPNSAPRVLGKLEPLGGSSKDPPPKFTSIPPKSAPQNSNPPASISHTPERPRTSRGANDRSNPSSETAPVPKESRETPPPQQVVGGGSRFLKKNDPSPQTPATATVKADVLKIEPPKGKVLGKMDYVDSESEDEGDEEEDDTPSSVLSGPLDGELAGDSHLFLNVDHLAPAKEVSKPAKLASNNQTKPPPQNKQQPPKSQPQLSTVTVAQPVVPAAKTVTPMTKPDPSIKKTDPQTTKSDPPTKSASPTATPDQKPVVSASKTDPQTAKTVAKPVSNLVQQNQTLLEEGKLKTEHENRLKELKSKLKNDEETEKKKLSDEMKERLKKFRTELEQSEVKQKNEIKFQHEKILNELKSKLQKEREQIENEGGDRITRDDGDDKKLTSVRTSYDEELEEMKKKFEADKRRLSNEFENELAKIKSDFDSKLHREKEILESDKIEKLKSLKIYFDKEIADERQKFESERNNKSLQLKRELDEIEKDIESEKSRLDSEKANLRANEKKFIEEKTKEMQEQIETEVAKRKFDLKQKHDHEVDDMQSEFENHLTKLRREFKEKLANEEQKFKHETVAEKQKEVVVNDTETHLTNLRRELNSLSELAKNLKSSFGDAQEKSKQDDISNAAPRLRSKMKPVDSKRKQFINSLDNFLSHEEESSGSTPMEEKLEMLESEDIVSKVQRFLASHETTSGKKRQRYIPEDSFDLRRTSAGTDVADYSNLVRRGADSSNLVIGGTKSLGNRSNITVKDALNTMQRDLKTLTSRVSAPNPLNYGPNRNIFRLQPRDAVDELVESKFRQYFSADRRRPNFQPENRRSNVEKELDSLKKWLEQFENDVASRKISSVVDPLDEEFAEV